MSMDSYFAVVNVTIIIIIIINIIIFIIMITMHISIITSRHTLNNQHQPRHLPGPYPHTRTPSQ